MKKLIFFMGIFLIVFSLVGCNQAGKTDNIKVNIGEYEKFSEKEINQAIDSVKVKFKGFKGCKLTDIWYDEKKSDKLTQDYMEYGGGKENHTKKENVIVFLSKFEVGSEGGDGSLEPNSTYTDWQWVVIRDNKTGKWKVNQWGY
ncbi:MAG: DUF4829 domain-containing protein [Paraclostridium sordellii]